MKNHLPRNVDDEHEAIPNSLPQTVFETIDAVLCSVILSILIFRILTAAATKILEGCFRIADTDAAVNCIRIERVHTKPGCLSVTQSY